MLGPNAGNIVSEKKMLSLLVTNESQGPLTSLSKSVLQQDEVQCVSQGIFNCV